MRNHDHLYCFQSSKPSGNLFCMTISVLFVNMCSIRYQNGPAAGVWILLATGLVSKSKFGECSKYPRKTVGRQSCLPMSILFFGSFGKLENDLRRELSSSAVFKFLEERRGRFRTLLKDLNIIKAVLYPIYAMVFGKGWGAGADIGQRQTCI